MKSVCAIVALIISLHANGISGSGTGRNLLVTLGAPCDISLAGGDPTCPQGTRCYGVEGVGLDGVGTCETMFGAECTTDGDCGDLYVCYKSRCQLPDGPGGVGDECGSERNVRYKRCPEGLKCMGGTQTSTCGGLNFDPCSEDFDCGGDLACINGECNYHPTFDQTCSTDADCQGYYACVIKWSLGSKVCGGRPIFSGDSSTEEVPADYDPSEGAPSSSPALTDYDYDYAESDEMGSSPSMGESTQIPKPITPTTTTPSKDVTPTSSEPAAPAGSSARKPAVIVAAFVGCALAAFMMN